MPTMKTNDKSSGSTVPRIVKTDEEWRNQLAPEQYRVLRQAGTERPFGPAYEEFKKQGGGTYVCAGCGAELFSSKERFDSHCGWPSFYDPANAKNVITRDDSSLGTVRTEVICAQCGGHLGHVFKGEGFKTPTTPLLHQRRSLKFARGCRTARTWLALIAAIVALMKSATRSSRRLVTVQ
jgi:peptide-methionine (R)-S-oxide reductase